MKKLLICFYAPLLLVSCQIEGNRPATLSIPKDSVDIGSVFVDSTYYLRFKLVNSGGGMLTLDTATAGCGCTVPKIGKHELLPRDSTKLYLTFRTPDTRYFKKIVVIKSNTPGGFTTVQFTGTARANR